MMDMSYGHGNSNLLMRTLPIGTGQLTDTKLSALKLLRDRSIEVSNEMVRAVFVEEPLQGIPDEKELDKILLGVQKEVKGLNKAYVEKARLSVKASVSECHHRYFKQLVGRLEQCSQKIETPTSQRKYFFVPESVQETVSSQELEQLEKLGHKKGLSRFQEVMVHGGRGELSETQLAVIREIHAQVQKGYQPPVYAESGEFTCQIHLDYRLIRESDAETRLDTAARLLNDKDNRCYQTFLEISHPIPRGEPIRIPLVLSHRVFKRFQGDSEASLHRLIVEIGAHQVHLRAIVAKEKGEANDIEKCEHLIGRDFGYRNTVTWSVLKRDGEIEESIPTGKAASKAYLESHVHPLDNIMERIRYRGQRFLSRIAKHASKIDRLRSEIDRLYNRLHSYKGILSGYLGLSQEEAVPREMVTRDPLLKHVHKCFFGLLEHLGKLKRRVSGLYKKIAGIKRTWLTVI